MNFFQSSLSGSAVRKKRDCCDPIRRIIAEVARQSGLAAADLTGRQREHHAVRVDAMRHARAAGYSYPVIAREFERSHSTVLRVLRGAV